MTQPTRLSKSKIMSGLQCQKRLWLEVHRPDLLEITPDMQQRFDAGHVVNDAARGLYPGGAFIDSGSTDKNLVETQRLLAETDASPLFEATFIHRNVVVRADVLHRDADGCRLVEVKSAASVKDPYYPDCAVQAWVLKGAGMPLQCVSLAHINNEFVYQGDGDYHGLFTEVDLTGDIKPLLKEVPRWTKSFEQTLAGDEPSIDIGDHCTKPYDCPFMNYCAPATGAFPLAGLPGRKEIAKTLAAEGITDIRDIPDGRLGNDKQEWVRQVTIAGRAELREDAVAALHDLGWPRHYLDFETVMFAVPIWTGTRPYQPLPFQWSCHIESADGKVIHREFLDTSGEPPMRACAESLMEALGRAGPVIVYGGYEGMVIGQLMGRFPDLAEPLAALRQRLVDLLPVVRGAYYHPEMRGSWSMKAVLPTIAPHLDYSTLGEVQEGGAAGATYLELIHPKTEDNRRAQLKTDLLAYCHQDTLGLVEIMRYLTGR